MCGAAQPSLSEPLHPERACLERLVRHQRQSSLCEYLTHSILPRSARAHARTGSRARTGRSQERHEQNQASRSGSLESSAPSLDGRVATAALLELFPAAACAWVVRLRLGRLGCSRARGRCDRRQRIRRRRRRRSRLRADFKAPELGTPCSGATARHHAPSFRSRPPPLRSSPATRRPCP